MWEWKKGGRRGTPESEFNSAEKPLIKTSRDGCRFWRFLSRNRRNLTISICIILLVIMIGLRLTQCLEKLQKTTTELGKLGKHKVGSAGVCGDDGCVTNFFLLTWQLPPGDKPDIDSDILTVQKTANWGVVIIFCTFFVLALIFLAVEHPKRQQMYRDSKNTSIWDQLKERRLQHTGYFVALIAQCCCKSACYLWCSLLWWIIWFGCLVGAVKKLDQTANWTWAQEVLTFVSLMLLIFIFRIFTCFWCADILSTMFPCIKWKPECRTYRQRRWTGRLIGTPSGPEEKGLGRFEPGITASASNNLGSKTHLLGADAASPPNVQADDNPPTLTADGPIRQMTGRGDPRTLSRSNPSNMSRESGLNPRINGLGDIPPEPPFRSLSAMVNPGMVQGPRGSVKDPGMQQMAPSASVNSKRNSTVQPGQHFANNSDSSDDENGEFFTPDLGANLERTNPRGPKGSSFDALNPPQTLERSTSMNFNGARGGGGNQGLKRSNTSGGSSLGKDLGKDVPLGQRDDWQNKGVNSFGPPPFARDERGTFDARQDTRSGRTGPLNGGDAFSTGATGLRRKSFSNDRYPGQLDKRMTGPQRSNTIDQNRSRPGNGRSGPQGINTGKPLPANRSPPPMNSDKTSFGSSREPLSRSATVSSSSNGSTQRQRDDRDDALPQVSSASKLSAPSRTTSSTNSNKSQGSNPQDLRQVSTEDSAFVNQAPGDKSSGDKSSNVTAKRDVPLPPSKSQNSNLQGNREVNSAENRPDQASANTAFHPNSKREVLRPPKMPRNGPGNEFAGSQSQSQLQSQGYSQPPARNPKGQLGPQDGNSLQRQPSNKYPSGPQQSNTGLRQDPNQSSGSGFNPGVDERLPHPGMQQQRNGVGGQNQNAYGSRPPMRSAFDEDMGSTQLPRPQGVEPLMKHQPPPLDSNTYRDYDSRMPRDPGSLGREGNVLEPALAPNDYVMSPETDIEGAFMTPPETASQGFSPRSRREPEIMESPTPLSMPTRPSNRYEDLTPELPLADSMKRSGWPPSERGFGRNDFRMQGREFDREQGGYGFDEFGARLREHRPQRAMPPRRHSFGDRPPPALPPWDAQKLQNELWNDIRAENSAMEARSKPKSSKSSNSSQSSKANGYGASSVADSYTTDLTETSSYAEGGRAYGGHSNGSPYDGQPDPTSADAQDQRQRFGKKVVNNFRDEMWDPNQSSLTNARNLHKVAQHPSVLAGTSAKAFTGAGLDTLQDNGSMEKTARVLNGVDDVRSQYLDPYFPRDTQREFARKAVPIVKTAAKVTPPGKVFTAAYHVAGETELGQQMIGVAGEALNDGKGRVRTKQAELRRQNLASLDDGEEQTGRGVELPLRRGETLGPGRQRMRHSSF